MQLNNDQKWQVINKFIAFKIKQNKYKSILKQSSPEIGVWCDNEFYSFDLIFNAILNNKGSN